MEVNQKNSIIHQRAENFKKEGVANSEKCCWESGKQNSGNVIIGLIEMDGRKWHVWN